MLAGDLGRLQEEIHLAKKRLRLRENARTVSCLAADRVNRRHRGAKTDRMDATKLVTMLIRYQSGGRKVWDVVRVPSGEARDGRQPHRDLVILNHERTQHINRIKGLLAGQGIRMGTRKGFSCDPDKIDLLDRPALGPGLTARPVREFERMQVLRLQPQELRRKRLEALRHSARPEMEKVSNLVRQKRIRISMAWPDAMELPRPGCAGQALPGERSAFSKCSERWQD